MAGCQTQFLSALADAQNRGYSIIVIYLDICKAFDQVPHHKLLTELSRIGITDPLYSWVKSYLSNRTQVTLISGHRSSSLPITSGVIQGSVLGPTLFTIYINNILTCIKNGTAFLFADDFKLLYTFHKDNLTTTLPKIQADLNRLSQWSSAYELSFSVTKCFTLPYRCSLMNGDLQLCNANLPIANNIRDLGIRYSCTLSFSNQSLYQVSKGRQLLHLIIRSFHSLSIKVAIFKQHLRPVLEFYPFVASYLTKSCRLNIENVQRRFTKLLFPSDSLLSYRQRCETLNLNPLWLRRLILNLTFLHSLIYHLTHIADGRPTFHSNPKYDLRDTFSLAVPHSKTAFHRYSFLPNYSRIWNLLPLNIRSITCSHRFRRKLATYLTFNHVYELLNPQVCPDIFFEQGPIRI